MCGWPLSSSVTRGLSSGGNEADDEYDDDESVFAPVVIGVTSSIRWVSSNLTIWVRMSSTTSLTRY